MRVEASLPSEAAVLSRQPRLRVMVGGEILIGAYEAEVMSSNCYGADQFEVTAAIGLDAWADAAFWSSEQGLYVDVQVSIDGGLGYTSLVQGFVDQVSLDVVNGIVRLRGRDLSAALIEARTQEAFANRTASEIAAIFAQRHSLLPAVVPTSTPVGRYYGGSYAAATLDQFTRATTEWDLLVYLARYEQYDVFVKATALYFQPKGDPSTATTVLRPQDVSRIMLKRTLSLAGDVEVTIKSWNSQSQQMTVETVQSSVSSPISASGSGSAVAPKQYVTVRPNLSPDVALRFAQQQITEICRHERAVEIVMPGDLTLMAGDTILLEGTDTAFDQAYYVDSIRRQLQSNTGFHQSVILRNASPRTYTSASSQ